MEQLQVFSEETEELKGQLVGYEAKVKKKAIKKSGLELLKKQLKKSEKALERFSVQKIEFDVSRVMVELW